MDRAADDAQKWQRLGDFVAGTIVVLDRRPQLGGLREACRRRAGRADSFVSITPCSTGQAARRAGGRDDFAGAGRLSPREEQALLERLVRPLSARLAVECPAEGDWAPLSKIFWRPNIGDRLASWAERAVFPPSGGESLPVERHVPIASCAASPGPQARFLLGPRRNFN